MNGIKIQIKNNINFKFSIFLSSDKTDSRPNSVVGELKMEDDQLSQMLNTLMGEAKQIRGDQPYSTTV